MRVFLHAARTCAMLLAPVVVLLAQEESASPAGEPAPHIVLVLADDLGWTDLSTGRTSAGNGSPYHHTPHLDALAEAGTCFTNAYSSGPNCAPTRAALWSGQWAARTGVYTVDTGDRGRAANRRLVAAPNRVQLAPEVVTLAETLRLAGYATAHFGKWHLGDARSGTGPTDQGFEHAAGGNRRGGVAKAGHFADEQGAFDLPGLGANGVARQFLADRLTDEALAWMAGVDRPLFCCISHYSVHTPIAAPADALAATPPAPEGSRHRDHAYAAMVRNLDDTVGRLVDFLASADDPLRPGKKLLANTLVVFTSDNGGVGGYAAAGVEGAKEITNQLPLRSGKGSLHEGGVRVPFVVRWDGRARPGAIDPTPLATLDLYPTFAAIARAPVPASHRLDGLDLSSRFAPTPAEPPDRALFWNFPGYLEADVQRGTWRSTPCASIRRGDWKAIWWFEDRRWSLYDLAHDLGEANDLAAAAPDRLRPLAAELREWLERTEAPLARERDGAQVPLPEVPANGG